MDPHPRLNIFLAPFSTGTQDLALALRKFVTNLVPEANELIWDNYNALACAYSMSEELKDAFCHIAVYSKHVNFGFNRGSELVSEKIKLEGKGKLIRHIKVYDFEAFPKKEVRELLLQALHISEARNPDLSHKNDAGISIVKSISEKKIRPE